MSRLLLPVVFVLNLVACSDIDNINSEIRQFRTKSCAQIIAATFHKYYVEVIDTFVEFADRGKIHGSIFTYRGVWAAAGFYANDTVF